MKTILYNPIFINPQAYYVFPRLTRYLQPDNESTSEPANYIGTIEVKVIAYGDTTLKRTYTNTDSIDLSEFKNTWIRISLFTKVGSCVLGEWKIGNMESDLPYIDPEVLASLKAVVIVGNKTNNDSDRAIVKNLVDPDNPFVISNAAYTEGSGYADKDSPYYGAFVTDGIDDLITSTKTVQEMGITDEVTVVSMIHQIDLNSTYTIATTNYIENSNSREHVRSDVYNYGKTGIYGYSASLINNTKSDIKNILGDEADYYVKSTNSLQTIFDAKFSVVGRISELTEASQVAWYWTIIANKVLTTDQINQVIAYFNLDRTLKPDILCNTIKQGITNDNHAEFGDKLIDFSGNGRDIQLNNLAWDGDSGIGKYNYPNWKVTATIANTYSTIVNYPTVNGTYSINVNGVSELMQSIGLHLEIKYTTSTGIIYNDIKQDGVYSYILPDGATDLTLRFGGIPGIVNEPCNITITQIPSHAGALCLDGVNDFGKVTGMPVYKDYTFIIDRQIIFIGDTAGVVASKSEDSADATKHGAFIFEYLGAPDKISTWSFYKDNGQVANTDFTRGISYQSKYSYNGKDLTVGTSKDSDKLWLGTIRDNDSRFFNGAIYSLMSFPYSMSEFLIERQLKKHKLGTLYPDMVEFRPIVKSNNNWDIIEIWQKGKSLYRPAINDDKTGIYLKKDSTIGIYIKPKDADEVTKIVVNGTEYTNLKINSNGFYYVTFPITKSPQKIDITIDEYIRYEDIDFTNCYPGVPRIYVNDKSVTWGDKLKVGDEFTFYGNVNILPEMYNVLVKALYNGEEMVYGSIGTISKSMAFTSFKTYTFDDNEPKSILSPRLLRIPNSSYKILGYIPDISGHGNNGKINNSAYAEGSGVNEDGSYQFDGVDDFVTIPTIVGGKQVLMKVNWDKTIADAILYDQRDYPNEFAIYNADVDNNNNPVFAYQARNNGQTYIDGILNKNIKASELRAITHNITITNELSTGTNTSSPVIGSNRVHDAYFTNMALYDFMLFDSISTDDKILELNKYVGIEAKVELPPYYWDAYGKTNLDADKATIQQRGTAVGDYDLTNYNHAYDKMSGYGGYKFAKFDNELDWYLTPDNGYIDVVSRNGYSITLRNLSTSNYGWYFQNSTVKEFITKDIPFKVKANKSIRVYWDMHSYKSNGENFGYVVNNITLNPNEDTSINLRHLTEEELTELDANKDRMYYLLWFDLSTLAVDEEVTIEMLPLYPNGLAYDGITDYSKNANIPVLTDYTYIYKRTIINIPTNAATLLKGADKTNGGAFIADYGNKWQFNFGQYNIIQGIADGINWQTVNSFNGTSINKGENTDDSGITVAKFSNGYTSMVFYKLILYPKTISLLEINFLKNLMEKDEIIDLTNPIFIQE